MYAMKINANATLSQKYSENSIVCLKKFKLSTVVILQTRMDSEER